MKTPSPQSRDQWSRSLSHTRRLRNKSHHKSRRLRRLLFEQFEDRRVLATADDATYLASIDQTVDGNAWASADYNPTWDEGYETCTEEIEHPPELIEEYDIEHEAGYDE